MNTVAKVRGAVAANEQSRPVRRGVKFLKYGGGGLLLLAVIVSSLLSPLLAYKHLRQALADKDETRLATLVNYSALRMAFQRQFGAEMDKEMGDKMDKIGAKGQMVMRDIVRNLAISFSTPNAVLAMSRGVVTPLKQEITADPSTFSEATVRFGVMRFAVVMGGRGIGDIEFILHRHGLYTWTLDEITLPLSQPAGVPMTK